MSEQGGGACRLPGPGRPFDLSAVDPAGWEVGRRRAVWRGAAVRARVGPSASAPVRAVLLDMGGVVIPTLFESVAVPGFPAGPLAHEPAYGAVERGRTPERDYWAELARSRPDIDIGQLWRSCSYVRQEVREALRALAGRVRLVALTNDMAHWFGDSWPERFPELAAFDHLVEAARLGVLKPDPQAFIRTAEVIHEEPAGCLFVDDLAVNLDGARAAGMQTLLFDVREPGPSVAALLDRLGLQPDEGEPPGAFTSPRGRPEPEVAGRRPFLHTTPRRTL